MCLVLSEVFCIVIHINAFNQTRVRIELNFMNLVLIDGNIVKCISVVNIQPPSRFSIIIFLLVLVEKDSNVESSLIFGNESTLSCLVFLKQDRTPSCKGINRWSCFLALLYIIVTRNKHWKFRWIVALITYVCEHIIPCYVSPTWKVNLNAKNVRN
jgi:hypothetical protein